MTLRAKFRRNKSKFVFQKALLTDDFLIVRVCGINGWLDTTHEGTISELVKMNSLYQIHSKILHGRKVIIFGEKKEKELARPGFKLTTFVFEGEGANHYTMDP